MQPVEELQRGLSIIQQAPAVTISLLAAVVASTWFVAKLFYNSKVAGLEERIKLRDDQLSGKFQNTSPHEAMKLIEELQKSVDAIPRDGLSTQQVSVLRSKLERSVGPSYTIDVVQNGFASDALLRDVRRLFSQLQGWKLIDGSFQTGDIPPACGMLFEVSSESNPTSAEALVMSAFREAGVPFVLKSGRTEGHDVRLLVSVPL
jgi:hypothetical protein